jgi:hypothetical protein
VSDNAGTPTAYPAVPDELKQAPRWVGWRYEDRTGERPAKVPYDVRTGLRAQTDDSSTWTTFAEAVAAVERFGFAGVGHVFDRAAGYVGIDLDNSIDATGGIKPWAKRIIDTLPQSYWEISPSGAGVKGFFRGQLPLPPQTETTKNSSGRRPVRDPLTDETLGTIEAYHGLRFFTVTGVIMSGATSTVAEGGTALNWLWETHFVPKPTGKTRRSPGSPGDQELLDKARSAQNGTKFTTLFDWGDWQRFYQSQSEADLALCCELAFWTGKDANRIEGLFRQSALFREKWERADYRDETIRRAIAYTTNTYSRDFEADHGARCDRMQPKVATKRLATVDGWAVYQKKFEEPVLVIDKLLTAGLTVFAGRPKVGKSWLALDIAVSVATERKLFGELTVRTPGRVLYCGLEESQARTSRRLRALVPKAEAMLGNIEFVYALKPLTEGGAEQLDEYLTRNPSQLVVIDTLMAVLKPKSNRDILRSDYAEMNNLRTLAEKHGTAILVVHHLRKATAEYGLDAVAGTTGVTAACDAVWTMRRLPDGKRVLDITGREMEEQTYGLRLCTGDHMSWRLTGQGAEASMSEERKQIVELLKLKGRLKPAQIAGLLGKNPNTVRRLLQELVADDVVVRNSDGTYWFT